MKRNAMLMWFIFILLIPGPIILCGYFAATVTAAHRKACEAHGDQYVTGKGVEICLRKDVIL